MDEQRTPMSRRVLLAGGLAGTSAAIVLALAGPAAAESLEEAAYAEDLVDAQVDLLIAQGDKTSVTGTVDGTPVSAKGSLYGAVATVTGSLTKHPLAAIMTLRDQRPEGSGYVTSARLTTSVGDDALVLSGSFKLDSQYSFEHGSIAGTDRGSAVELAVESRSDGNGARLKGRFAGTDVDIMAIVPDTQSTGSVTGTVGVKRLDLHFHPVSGTESSNRLTGTFNGPVEMLAVIVGAVAYFAL